MTDLTSAELNVILQKLAPDAKISEVDSPHFGYRCSWFNQFAKPSTGVPRSKRRFDSRRSIARFFADAPQDIADHIIEQAAAAIEGIN